MAADGRRTAAARSIRDEPVIYEAHTDIRF